MEMLGAGLREASSALPGQHLAGAGGAWQALMMILSSASRQLFPVLVSAHAQPGDGSVVSMGYLMVRVPFKPGQQTQAGLGQHGHATTGLSFISCMAFAFCVCNIRVVNMKRFHSFSPSPWLTLNT